MAVEVKMGSSFEIGVPKDIFDLAPLRAISGTTYAATADGRHFVLVTQGQEAAKLQFTVIVNWAAYLKK